MAGLTGKDGERCKGKEAESGRPKTIARRSLKDILAATNSQAKDRSGESQTGANQGDAEVSS